MGFQLPLYIQTPIVGVPIVYAFGTQLWSGQPTSYRTGDEQSIRSTSWFAYNPTLGQNSTMARLSNWTTLSSNNSFGNTSRFTSTTGGTAPTAGERTFIDNLTGLQWYVPATLSTLVTWNDAIDAALALTYDGFSDWKLPPIKVYYSIGRHQATVAPLNYAPFNNSASDSYWTSTTSAASTAQALRFTNTQAAISAVNKTGTASIGYFVRRWIP